MTRFFSGIFRSLGVKHFCKLFIASEKAWRMARFNPRSLGVKFLRRRSERSTICTVHSSYVHVFEFLCPLSRFQINDDSSCRVPKICTSPAFRHLMYYITITSRRIYTFVWNSIMYSNSTVFKWRLP